MAATEILALTGLLLSMYAMHVKKKAQNKKYKALCDFNNKVSCTKAFTSKYSNLLFFDNAFLGGFFYFAMLILAGNKYFLLYTILAGLAALGSLYLAYLSYIKMKNFCVVCSAIYVVNILMLVLGLVHVI